MMNDPDMRAMFIDYLKTQMQCGIASVSRIVRLATKEVAPESAPSPPQQSQYSGSPNPTIVVRPNITVTGKESHGDGHNPRFIAMQKGSATWPSLPKPQALKMYPEIAEIRAYRTQMKTFTHSASPDFSVLVHN